MSSSAAAGPSAVPSAGEVANLHVTKPTKVLSSLLALPSARGVPVLRPGRSLNTNRPTNREAYVGQIAGVVAALACSHCAGGSGPWKKCVIVAGFFAGSCANCHYGSEGARCSLRTASVAASSAGSNSPTRTPSSNRARRHSTLAQADALPLCQVAPADNIVDGVAPAPSTTVPRPRLSFAQRARRFAELHRELADLYEEEADLYS